MMQVIKADENYAGFMMPAGNIDFPNNWPRMEEKAYTRDIKT